MTTLRDVLEREHGTHTRLFLKIDGLEPIFAESSHLEGDEGITGPTVLFACGYDGNGSAGELWRYQDAAWTEIGSSIPSSIFSGHPSVSAFTDLYPLQVWGVASDDFWIGTSSEGTILHYYQGTWTAYWASNGLPAGVANMDTAGFWGSASNDVYCVTADDHLLHWNGSAWSEDTSISDGMLTAGSQQSGGYDATNVFIGCMDGYVYTGYLANWSEYAGSGSTVHATWAASDQIAWIGCTSGKVYKTTDGGATWGAESTGLSGTSTIKGIWGTSASDVWAVNNEGQIAHWNGSSWSLSFNDGDYAFEGVWGTGTTTVYAVGSDSGTGDGAVLHYFRGSWIDISGGFPSTPCDDDTFTSIFAVTSTRTVLDCLHPPDEIASGLDLGEMATTRSAINIQLQNIPDPDDGTKSYFAKLFAPGKHTQSGVYKTVMQRKDSGDRYLDADAQTIYCLYNTDWPASGTLHTGQETITYTGKSTDTTTGDTGFSGRTIHTFTGCSRGLYPALGSVSIGRTVPYPKQLSFLQGDVGAYPTIQSEPYSFIGRRVGLYLTAWDEESGAWFDFDDAELVWAGSITGEVTYRPQNDTWIFPCKSILDELERELCSDLPKLWMRGINLNGTHGRSFMVKYFRVGAAAPDAFGAITIAAGYYETPADLMTAINDELQDTTNWSGTLSGVGKYVRLKSLPGTPPKTALEFMNITNDDDQILLCPMTNGKTGSDMAAGNIPCHALQALGLGAEALMLQGNNDPAWPFVEFPHPQQPNYQPMGVDYNGGEIRAYFTGNDEPWDDQGDYGTTIAHLMCRGEAVRPEGWDGEKGGIYVAAYSSKSAASYALAGYEFTLPGDGQPPGQLIDPRGFVSSEGILYSPGGGEVLELSQCYCPRELLSSNSRQGPLETLLYPLHSTGTQDVNGSTYDKCPYPLAIGIPAALIDADSFIAMDKLLRAAYPALADRSFYPIYDPVSFRALWLREAKLFGLALVWRNSKITCVDVFDTAPHLYRYTLDDDSKNEINEYPPVRSSVETVINQWKIDLNYDHGEEKYLTHAIINDQDSQFGMATVKSISIEHPGLRLSDASQVETQLTELLSDRMRLVGTPWQTIERSISCNWVNKITIAEVVLANMTAFHPDPFGTGDMDASTYGLVLNHSWSHAAKRGRVTLLLWPSDEIEVPWAAAAVTDQSATNGGWDSTNYRLTLLALAYGDTGDTDDGARFSAGDKIKIIERAPSDPTAPLSWSATVASDYETDGAQLLTLDTVTLSGWDADVEYRVVPDDYGTATSAQKSSEAYQADPQTHLLGGTDAAHRWG